MIGDSEIFLVPMSLPKSGKTKERAEKTHVFRENGERAYFFVEVKEHAYVLNMQKKNGVCVERIQPERHYESKHSRA